ncbi:DNA glycosylase, partial [Russula brevipes]
APLPAKLIFSLEDAKDHLVRADRRFRDVFSRLPCKPFETLENVQPFRSVLRVITRRGQQISWLAARAIQHKFLRLFFPELPEKPDEQYWTKTRQDVFPTAYQVATTDLTTLKAAGLSGRKAEYVRDLATRFADGRLTNQKLLDANDDELLELLTAVYGIGKWTVEMFAIFSLRRPDILPVGDLGVQRGLLRWVLSQHQSEFRIEISPKKLPGVSASDKMETDSDQEVEEGAADELPSLNGLPDGNANAASIALPVASAARTTAPAPGALGLSSMPPPLTPSVTRILTRTPDAPPPPPLPAGLTVTSLRSRLGGKKR